MFRTDSALARLTLTGRNAYAFGGDNEDTDADLVEADLRIRVRNNSGKDTLAQPGRIRLVNGRQDVLVNDREIVREMIREDF